jgi:hypothetical protein
MERGRGDGVSGEEGKHAADVQRERFPRVPGDLAKIGEAIGVIEQRVPPEQQESGAGHQAAAGDKGAQRSEGAHLRRSPIWPIGD